MFSKNIQKDNLKVDESGENSSTDLFQQLEDTRSMMETLYDVHLPPIPVGIDLKEFCVGLLEKPDAHPWKGVWETLPARKRYGISHSLFLFRKLIPSSDSRKNVLKKAVRRLVTPSEPVDPRFLDFIKSEVPKIFRPGWDKKHPKNIASLTLSTNSCFESSQRDGGARALNPYLTSLRSDILHGDYLPCDKRARVSAVPDGGKFRVVTSNSVRHHALRPLHHTIYDHLSKSKWLLRGEPQPSSFDGFFTKHGQEFCSGDYEAATDNIPFEVYRTMLLAVESTSSAIGSNEWSLAFRQVERELVTPFGTFKARRGQLMGSYLSFPFLCLLNRLIFLYTVGGGPCKINGDDIVFRASPEKIKLWKETVGSCGLILSPGKTMVHPSVFTLNSAIFRGFDHHVQSLSFLRPRAFFVGKADPDSLKGRYESFVVGGPAVARAKLKALFLRRYQKALLSTQRSLSRGLGMRVNRAILKLAGLWKREQFYLKAPLEMPVPKIRSSWSSIPDGWRQIEGRLLSKERLKEAKEEEKLYFGSELLDCVWASTFRLSHPELLWVKMREGTLRWGPTFHGNFRIRFSKVYLDLQASIKSVGVPKVRKVKKVWVR